MVRGDRSLGPAGGRAGDARGRGDGSSVLLCKNIPTAMDHPESSNLNDERLRVVSER